MRNNDLLFLKVIKMFLMNVICFIILFFLTGCNAKIDVYLYDENNLVKQETVKNGQKYDFGKINKEGYTFVGWYTDEDGGQAYTDSNGSSAGMIWNKNYCTTLYARWSANNYKIIFDYCGATSFVEIDSIEIIYDSKIEEKFPVPQKKGSYFLGWYTKESGGVAITDANGNLLDSAEMFNSNLYAIIDDESTLYAHWGKKTVTYIFNTEGTEVTSVTFPVGTTIYELPTSFVDNYCFVSWCFDSTLLNEINLPYTISEESDEYINLYAKFIKGSIDILQFNSILETGDKEYEVNYEGNADLIVIPDYYYGKKVTKINKINSEEVSEVIIPNSINTLSVGSFANCTALQKVNIPNSINEIPNQCFQNCKSLTEILIPQNVIEIGTEAFSGCVSIVELELPTKINKIGTGAFRNMNMLKKFILNNEEGRYLVINDVLYYKISNTLHLVQYPAGKNNETYDIADNTTKILEYAFSSSKISTITIGGQVSNIEKGAFEKCEKLISVSIISNASIFTIEDDAFLNCSNFKSLKIETPKTPILSSTAFIGVSDTFSIYVSSSMMKNYQTAQNWKLLSNQIYSLGTIYGDFAVEEIDGGYVIRQYFGTGSEVIIPEIINTKKIIKISENAFSNSNIEKVTISKNIEEIGSKAFINCNLLKSIIMECEPPILGDRVFENINNDFAIYIKNSIDVLETYKKTEQWKIYLDKIWSYQEN